MARRLNNCLTISRSVWIYHSSRARSKGKWPRFTAQAVRRRAATATSRATGWFYNSAGLLSGKAHGWDTLGAPTGVVDYTYTPGGPFEDPPLGSGVIDSGGALTTTYHYHPGSGKLTYVDYNDNTHSADLAYLYNRAGQLVEVVEGDMTGVPIYGSASMFCFGGNCTLIPFGTWPSALDPTQPFTLHFTGVPQLDTEHPGFTENSSGNFQATFDPSTPSMFAIVELDQTDFTTSGKVHTYSYGSATNLLALATEEIDGLQLDGAAFPRVTLNRHYEDGQNGTVPGRTLGFDLARSGVTPVDYDLEYGYNTGGLLSNIVTDSATVATEKTHSYQYNVLNDASIWSYRDSGETGGAAIADSTRVFEPARYGVKDLYQFGTNHHYTYDPSGRRQTHTINSGAATQAYTYGYNTRGELTSAEDAFSTIRNRAYDYDEIGNRKKMGVADTDPVNAPSLMAPIPITRRTKLNEYSVHRLSRRDHQSHL